MAQADQDTEAAIATYREALELPIPARLSLGARLNLAALLLKNHGLDEAIRLTTEATQAAPEVALSWFNLGLMQRRKGNIAAAIQAYGESLQRQPDHPECHQNLAVALLMGGDVDGARKGFHVAIALLEEQGRQDEADALFNQLKGIVKLDEVAA